MSTLELFATSIIAALFLGAILGALAMSLMFAAADRRERTRERELRREIRKLNYRTDQLNRVSKHLGTPYRAETIAAALGPDTHNGSRKAAPPLEVVR